MWQTARKAERRSLWGAALGQTIFQDQLQTLYVEETQARDALTHAGRTAIQALCEKIIGGSAVSEPAAIMLTELQRKLNSCRGKKVYGFLPPEVKRLVDNIVDELAKEEDLSALYRIWHEKRSEIFQTYNTQQRECLPLSRQKTFQSVKNAVIKSALTLSDVPQTSPPTISTVFRSHRNTMMPVETSPSNPETLHQRALAQTTFLLHSLGKLFRQNEPVPTKPTPAMIHLDSKRLRELAQKKQSLGHAAHDRDHSQSIRPL